MAISRLKKIFSYLPLFCWCAIIVFLLYNAIVHAHLSGKPLFTGEDYIGYTLALFVLSFPLGSFFIFVLALVGFGGTAFFNPFSVFILTIVATLGFYVQWYVLYPKLRKIILRKYFSSSENYFIFDILIFILIVFLILFLSGVEVG